MQRKTDRHVTDEVKTLLKKLISFRSTGDRPDELEKLADFVTDYFRESPVFIDRYQFGDKPALVITTQKTKQPKIFFQGHLDVVDGNDTQFVPQEKGNRLYGRGAVDMKGFDAIVLHLIRETARLKKDYDIGIMLTFDEEIGSENGAKRLSELDYSCGILINGDGGYNHKLIYAEKGILKFKLSVEAIPGRHPYPWQGENAFDILIRNYNKIIALFPDQELATDNDNWYTTYSTYDVHV
ncbi:MAG: M20 family metallopeptidase [Calditrichaeota bacterium]|nr:M20 family metallopeptidase [Calditrichota bacterium]